MLYSEYAEYILIQSDDDGKNTKVFRFFDRESLIEKKRELLREDLKNAFAKVSEVKKQFLELDYETK